MTTEYNASSIRILSDADATDRFIFARVEAWSNRYPSHSIKALTRLAVASQEAGASLDEVENYYLKGNKAVVPTRLEELQAIYKETLKDTYTWR